MPLLETNLADFNQVSQEFILNNVLIPSAAAPREFGLNPADPRAAGRTCVVSKIKIITSSIPGIGNTTVFAETYPTPGPTSISQIGGPNPAFLDNFLLDPNVIAPIIAVARYGNRIGGTPSFRYELGSVTLPPDSEGLLEVTPIAFTFNPARAFNWFLRFEVSAGGENNTFMQMRWSEF